MHESYCLPCLALVDRGEDAWRGKDAKLQLNGVTSVPTKAQESSSASSSPRADNAKHPAKLDISAANTSRESTAAPSASPSPRIGISPRGLSKGSSRAPPAVERNTSGESTSPRANAQNGFSISRTMVMH